MTVVEDSSDVAQVLGIPQPRQLIVSLYGLCARPSNGWMSVAAVVRLMAELGVDEQAVRSSISRLKRRDLLVAQRVNGTAGYTLSPMTRDVLADGDARIFGRRRATVTDGWLLVVFSVPESERDKRYQLRSQLTRLGFGTVAPGVSNWWDLAELRRLYAEFLDQYLPVRERLSAASDDEPAKAFAEYVELVTAWRQLPYAEPGPSTGVTDSRLECGRGGGAVCGPAGHARRTCR